MRESAAGPARHGDAARHARLRARLGRAAAVRRRRPLVAAPPPPDARRLLRARSSATGSRSAASSSSSVFALAIVMGLAREAAASSGGRPRRPSSSGSRCSSRSSVRISSRRTGCTTRGSAQRRSRLERIEHVRHIPIVVEDVHDVTSLPNAEATGLGPSRRVVLWDTIVSELHTARGHGRHRRTSSAISRTTTSGRTSAGTRSSRFPASSSSRGSRDAGAAWRSRRPCRSRSSCSSSLTLVAQPIQNAISRHMEAEADWSALQATRDPVGATRALPSLRPDDARRAEPVDVRIHPAREPSDDHAAHRDGAGLAFAERQVDLGGVGRPVAVQRRVEPSCERAALRASPARRRGRARAPRSGRHRGSSRAGAR